MAQQQGDNVMPFVSRYEAARPTLPGAAQPWAAALREDGISRFRSLGLPSRRTEAWKYTDVKALAKLDFAPAPVHMNGLAAPLLGAVDAAAADHAMVFVNGRFRPDLSRLDALPDGATLDSTAALLDAGAAVLSDRLGRTVEADGRPFAALNAAMMQDGFVLRLAPGTVVERPIRVAFLTDYGGDLTVAVHSRNLIVAAANSRATVLEVHRGRDGAAYFSNGVTELEVDDGARLHHYKLQDEGDGAFHLATILARLGRDATYDSFILSLGAGWARNDIQALLDGPGVDCRLNGAYLGRRRQHLDTTTVIDHAHPDCRSREVYKGVLDDRARGVFQGKIRVRRDAQRTDGYQLNRAMLLSKGAEADSKPELEIYADDVKCSHGATVGEIDHDALFYLRARGIGEDAARAMLIEAFLADALQEIDIVAVRDEFAGHVTGWLNAGEHAA